MALQRPSLVLYLTSQTACMAFHRPHKSNCLHGIAQTKPGAVPHKPNCLHGIAQTKPGAVPHKSNCLHGIAQTKPWPRMLTSSFLLQEWREDCPEDGQDGGLPRLPEGRSLARQPCSGTAPKHWMCCGTQACLHACWQAVYTEKALLILLAKSSGVHQLQKNSQALVVPGWLLVCSRAQNLSHNWCMSEIFCNISGALHMKCWFVACCRHSAHVPSGLCGVASMSPFARGDHVIDTVSGLHCRQQTLG